MALQSFVGPWALFQFLDPLQNRQDSLDRGSALRKTSTIRKTQNKRTQTSMHEVGFEPTIKMFERTKTVHALDRAVIGHESSNRPTL
jgi:hypothetical protein